MTNPVMSPTDFARLIRFYRVTSIYLCIVLTVIVILLIVNLVSDDVTKSIVFSHTLRGTTP